MHEEVLASGVVQHAETSPAPVEKTTAGLPKRFVEPEDVKLGGPTYRALFGKSMRVGSLVAVTLSLVLPKSGNLGVSLCWFKRSWDLPCPGCGLTRSFVCMGHGHFRDAFHYHPFGPFLFLVAVASVIGFALGHSRRMKIAAWFSRHQRSTRFLYWAVVVSFIAFGFVRLACVKLLPGVFDNI